MIAVIIGSTGLTGNILLNNLLLDAQIKQVISVSRRTTGIHNPKLSEVIIEDFLDLKSKSDQLIGDYYFCALGTTIKKAKTKENFYKIDFQAVLDFATIAREHCAKSLCVISAMGTKEESSFYYNQVKAKIENELKKLGLKRLVIFKPALLIGDRIEFRLGEYLATKLLSAIFKKNNGLITYVDSLAAHMHSLGLSDKEGIYFIKAKDI